MCHIPLFYAGIHEVLERHLPQEKFLRLLNHSLTSIQLFVHTEMRVKEDNSRTCNILDFLEDIVVFLK